MVIPFTKYQGAGNDFIVIDQREKAYLQQNDQDLVARYCDRHFGIGADGLMVLQSHDTFDFEMVYYNADGFLGSMCGNGGRCIVAFAKRLGIIDHSAHFLAVDGPHEASISEDGWIALRMNDVQGIEQGKDYYFLDTGSPHYVTFVSNTKALDVVTEGRKVRYNKRFAQEGTNVNFVEQVGDLLHIVTYERGVEDETLACGTGVTAAALAQALRMNSPEDTLQLLNVKAKGGDLSVQFKRIGDHFKDIWLNGPATFVFDGKI